MKKIDYYILPVLLLLAAGVFYYRYNKGDVPATPNHQQDLTQLLIDFPQIADKPATLVALLDPMNDCPGCVQEVFTWVEPLADCPAYHLLMLLPEEMPEEEVQAFTGSLGLGSSHIARFSLSGAAARLREGRVLKLFHEVGSGFTWEERGNLTPQQHRVFANRLGAALAIYGCPVL